MKKFGQKFLTLGLAGLVAFGTVACGGGDAGGNKWDDVSIPANPTSSSSSVDETVEGVTNPYKLTVHSFTGGYGEDWLNALARRYKQARAGIKFTVAGKEYDGVDFEFTKDKTLMSGMAQKGLEFDVWFEEQVFYNQLITQGNIFKDMTDVMTSDNPYEPGVTLESKLSAEQKAYYKVDTNNDGVADTYYGIPHYAGYVGLVYNKNLFQKNGWYLMKDYEEYGDLAEAPDDCFTDDLTNRTAGPDGMEGTDDDGLPTTYEEYFALCSVIDGTYKPLTWTGGHSQGYINWFLTALTANYEGLEQMSLNYSFDGTATNLISVDADGNVTNLDPLAINPQNGYELMKQAGKYYALDFMEQIIDNTWHTNGSINGSYEQTAAQEDFVKGPASTSDDKRAAMLIEGVWWEMEAKRVFDDIQQNLGRNDKDNFGWMPLPCATKEKAEERATKLQNGENGYTLVDTHNALAFIGHHVSDEVYAIAKDFIQFAYTDESLAEFSIITDTTKAVNYTMTPEQKAQMSAFGRSLVEIKEKADIVYSYSQNTFYQLNEASISNYNETYNSLYDGKDVVPTAVAAVVDALRKGSGKPNTAVPYFNHMYSYQKTRWESGQVQGLK